MRCFLLWVWAGSLFAANTGKQAINASDLLKIQRVTEVEVAAGGSFAVYGVQSVFTDHTNKDEPNYSYRTHLFRIDLTREGAVPQQLTAGDRNDGNIAISPDGKKLAFVRAGEGKKEPQVWLLPLDGPGEAMQLTKLEHGAAAPVWRPDGKVLLVSTATPISKIEGQPVFALERPGREWFDWDRPRPKSATEMKDTEKEKVEARPDGDRKSIRNWLERNSSRDNPTTITRVSFQDEMGLAKEMRVVHLFEVDVSTQQAKQLTRGFLSLTFCSYSSDSVQLVCTGRQESVHPDRTDRGLVYLMNADGSSLHVLFDQPNESFLQARFESSGRVILLLSTQTDDPMFRQSRIGRFDPRKKNIEWLTANWDSAVQQMRQASTGDVLFSTSWQGGVALKTAEGGALKDLITGPVGVGPFDEGGGRIVYSLIQVPNPNELFVREKDGKTRQLTRLNAEWLENKKVAVPEEKWITRPDGTRLQMWVMNPIDAQQGKKYPWVLDMHGGPAAMWGPGELSMWHEFQMFCAWGYGVVYANPRGSTGYGYAFQKANYKNWGEGPSSDVLAALDETVKSNPLVDADRLFLTGGSYAGYLTAWIIGHDARFKAAVAQRGVYDLTTFYGEGNAYRLVKNHFGGRPFEPETRKLLEEQSPFTYVTKIRTPFLIIHGNNDLRTGVSQSEMLYRALKDLGRQVEYVRYPNIGHELTRSGPPLQRMDHMLRIIEFFERYSGNDAPAPATTN